MGSAETASSGPSDPGAAGAEESDVGAAVDPVDDFDATKDATDANEGTADATDATTDATEATADATTDAGTDATEATADATTDATDATTDATGATADATTDATTDANEAPSQAPSQSRDVEHSQRLESIGILAGGIAHDFNNLLTGILGQISLALALLPPDSPARPPINKAAGAAERAADMTRQLLAYAGKGQFQLSSVRLNDLIIENLGMLETVLPRRVDLKLDLDSDLPAIEADRGQVQQVLMNLVLNAAESIEDETGRVTVATGTVDGASAPGPFLGRDRLSPAPYVLLAVTDTGTGMSEATAAQMFDPFFSTKGSGRGLGLSAALGIIHAHEGAMQVDSRVGSGTVFRVLLPVATTIDAIAPAASDDRPTRGDAASASSVLVIDDEAAVREATHDMLAAAGYDVLVADGGPAGIERYTEHAADIGLVLLDMQMPGMSGDKVFEALKRQDPAARVILMSGYSESEATRRFLGKGLLGFLQKPYDFETLSRTVGEALS